MLLISLQEKRDSSMYMFTEKAMKNTVRRLPSTSQGERPKETSDLSMS
jgi:hypothetical protein